MEGSQSAPSGCCSGCSTAAAAPNMAKILQDGARARAKKLLSTATSTTDGGSPSGGAVLKGLRALGWRQQFQFSREYCLPMLDEAATLIVRQIEMGEVKGLGTGANVWPAAVVLAKYLEKKYGSVQHHGGEGGEEEGSSSSSRTRGMAGLRVADLGCGTGLTGLAAGVLGASEVYLTDQAQILFLAQENAHKCSAALGDRLLPSSRLHAVEYNWGGDAGALLPLPLDVLLVSDCLLPKLYPIEPLVQAIDQLSGPHTITIVSYEPRDFAAYDPVAYLDGLLEARGLARIRVADQDLDQDYWAEDIEVWEIRRRRQQGGGGGGGAMTPTTSGGQGEGAQVEVEEA